MACPSCGTSITDIIKGGKLGCVNCYDSFSDMMPYIVGSVQMGGSDMRHVGRVPSSFIMQKAKSASYEDVRKEMAMRMDSASARQDYSQAARMKAKIAELDELNKDKGRADLAERLALFVFDFWNGSEALD